MRQAVRDALLQHKRAGHPVAVWRDGGVVWIPPDEIPAQTAASEDDAALGHDMATPTK